MSENKNIDPKLNEILRGMWDSLTDEQKEKANACKTLDELTALAAKEGVELPDKVLDQVAGGCGGGSTSESDRVICPRCGREFKAGRVGWMSSARSVFDEDIKYRVHCPGCGYEGKKKSDWIIP
ncbi:MAG: hypothetical protein IJU66_01060 [Oscillospiraceae bacterium]|nr:hypothetical protein [Oscillospiraceae bacterium]